MHVEKIFKLIQEISKGHRDILLTVVQILQKNIFEAIKRTVANDFEFNEFSSLFHMINTMSLLLEEFEFSLKQICSTKNNLLIDSNSTHGKKNHPRKLSSTFRKMSRSFEKSIQLLEKHCHLAQVLLMLRKCFLIIHNILKCLN